MVREGRGDTNTFFLSRWILCWAYVVCTDNTSCWFSLIIPHSHALGATVRDERFPSSGVISAILKFWSLSLNIQPKTYGSIGVNKKFSFKRQSWKKINITTIKNTSWCIAEYLTQLWSSLKSLIAWLKFSSHFKWWVIEVCLQCIVYQTSV